MIKKIFVCVQNGDVSVNIQHNTSVSVYTDAVKTQNSVFMLIMRPGIALQFTMAVQIHRKIHRTAPGNSST